MAFTPGKFATKFKTLLASESKRARVNEDYFNNGNYNIYWPYSENFGASSQTPLTVPADKDTDMKNVPHPECGSNPMIDCNPDGTVTVDDYFASANITHIIGDIPPQLATILHQHRKLNGPYNHTLVARWKNMVYLHH